MISKIYNLLLGLLVIYLVQLLPSQYLWDRDNYLNYAENSEKILQSYGDLQEVLFNDYFFLKINQLLSYVLSPENLVVFLVSICFLIFYFLINKFSVNSLTFTIGVIFSILIVPILHLEVVAIRQFLATCLVLLSLSYYSDKNKILIIFLIASLIHSSFFLFFFLFYMDNYIFCRFDKIKRFILNFLLILFLALSYLVIGNYLGFRQAELYSSYSGAVGGGGFVVVFSLTLYIYFKYGITRYTYMYNFVLQGFLLFMIFYFFANSSVSARLLESIFPAFILLLVNKFRPVDLIVILFIFLTYGYVWLTGGQYMIFEASPDQIRHYFGW
ncbi:EpsG family protein [Acinetobacter sp. Marseille-Q1623]|uniref:EpsG family protein n=1 Tax=Acinetobacter sp. Marseille-Q1623 TaxID=2697501 RepID=UPI001E33F706|nr:EpsG family protein [Acinetobacter sp. Marseille-Q1623]